MAKRANGLHPALNVTTFKTGTLTILNWLESRRPTNGRLPPYENSQLSKLLGYPTQRQGARVVGQIQSRIDLLCYLLDLPPLGLIATRPFKDAWTSKDPLKQYPVERMMNAARERSWQPLDFFNLTTFSTLLGSAVHTIWERESAEHWPSVLTWAEGLNADGPPPGGKPNAALAKRLKIDLRRPEIKPRLDAFIERGSTGRNVKKFNGYKCQICEALGLHPHTFYKPDKTPYVEAHHVTPVSRLEVGSLSARNVITVCANHHRELHYGGVEPKEIAGGFQFEIDGRPLAIRTPQSLD